MTTRRNYLLSFISGTIVGGSGAYIGFSEFSSGYGSIEWINERNDEVWVNTTVGHGRDPISEGDIAYQSDYRIFPTEHNRAGDTNVVETGTYTVEVGVESVDRSTSSGPFTTTWTPAGCHHRSLIIRVSRDLSVEFDQKEC